MTIIIEYNRYLGGGGGGLVDFYYGGDHVHYIFGVCNLGKTIIFGV